MITNSLKIKKPIYRDYRKQRNEADVPFTLFWWVLAYFLSQIKNTTLFLSFSAYLTYPLQRMKKGAKCTFEKFRMVSLFAPVV